LDDEQGDWQVAVDVFRGSGLAVVDCGAGLGAGFDKSAYAAAAGSIATSSTARSATAATFSCATETGERQTVQL